MSFIIITRKLPLWNNKTMKDWNMFRIADLSIQMEKCPYKTFPTIAKDYICEGETVDLHIEVSESDIDYEYSQSVGEFSRDYVHSIATCRKLAEKVPFYNAILLHSACFDVDGVGVAFAAHSGTGKTTHMRLWQEYLGERMTIVNGDKPIIRFFDDDLSPQGQNGIFPYAYGTPWNGKEHYGCNMRTPLKHICFIERAEQNSCEPMSSSEAVDRIMNQVYMPSDPQALLNTIRLIDRLIHSCSLWRICCNMEPDAAKIAYHTIFG